jgi:hypothetical protein
MYYDAKILKQMKIESSIILEEPLKNKMDENGLYTIKLNSGITLKATKSELRLLINNLEKMLGTRVWFPINIFDGE